MFGYHYVSITGQSAPITGQNLACLRAVKRAPITGQIWPVVGAAEEWITILWPVIGVSAAYKVTLPVFESASYRGGRTVNHWLAVSIPAWLVIEVRLYIHLKYGKKFASHMGIKPGLFRSRVAYSTPTRALIVQWHQIRIFYLYGYRGWLKSKPGRIVALAFMFSVFFIFSGHYLHQTGYRIKRPYSGL